MKKILEKYGLLFLQRVRNVIKVNKKYNNIIKIVEKIMTFLILFYFTSTAISLIYQFYFSI